MSAHLIPSKLKENHDELSSNSSNVHIRVTKLNFAQQPRIMHVGAFLYDTGAPARNHRNGPSSDLRNCIYLDCWVFECCRCQIVDSWISSLLIQLVLSPYQHLQQTWKLWICHKSLTSSDNGISSAILQFARKQHGYVWFDL